MTGWIPELARLLETGAPVVMVTIIASEGSAPREVGARMLVHEGGFAFTVGGGRLELPGATRRRGEHNEQRDPNDLPVHHCRTSQPPRLRA